jgi:predicted small secreted protein
LLKYALANKDRNMVDALMPYFDWKLIQLMKQSFEKEFAIKIKNAFGKELSNVRLAPSWLNTEDFSKIMSASNLPYIAPECSDVPGLSDLLKFLGNKPEDVGSLIVKADNAQISVLGCAQILTAGMKEALMNHRLPSLTTTALVMSNGGLCSLKEINDEEGEIDESYIKLMEDNGMSKNDISQFLKKTGLSNINDLLFDEDDDDFYDKEDDYDDLYDR